MTNESGMGRAIAGVETTQWQSGLHLHLLLGASGTVRYQNGFAGMWRTLLLMLPLLASCSKGPEADLQYISDARSAAAEWALVNQQARQGKVTGIYVRSMHQWLRQQIQTDLAGLSQTRSPYAAEMQTLSQLPDDATPEQLRSHAERLKQQENALESA